MQWYCASDVLGKSPPSCVLMRLLVCHRGLQAGCFTGGLHEDLCTNALHAWGAQMCEREHKQFMKPYCEGGNIKIGLFGSDSECKQLVASEEVGVSRTTGLKNCFYRDFFNHSHGPWSFTHDQWPKSSQWHYSLQCDQFDQSTLQYHTVNCTVGWLIFTEWPLDPCMDTRDAACADWDPGFALRYQQVSASVLVGKTS